MPGFAAPAHTSEGHGVPTVTEVPTVKTLGVEQRSTAAQALAPGSSEPFTRLAAGMLKSSPPSRSAHDAMWPLQNRVRRVHCWAISKCSEAGPLPRLRCGAPEKESRCGRRRVPYRLDDQAETSLLRPLPLSSMEQFAVLPTPPCRGSPAGEHRYGPPKTRRGNEESRSALLGAGHPEVRRLPPADQPQCPWRLSWLLDRRGRRL